MDIHDIRDYLRQEYILKIFYILQFSNIQLFYHYLF